MAETIRDTLPLADLDILGSDTRHRYTAGNAMLADLTLRHCAQNGLDDSEHERAAVELEESQLHEVTAPAANLLDIALKLSFALRQGYYVLPGSPTGDAVYALITSCLSDVILLRQAELRRREMLDAQEAANG